MVYKKVALGPCLALAACVLGLGPRSGKLPLGASASCPHQISLIWRSQNGPGLFQITGSPFSQTRSRATRNLIEPNFPSAALLPACAAAGARLGEQTSPSPLSAAADYCLQGLCPCNCSSQAKPAWHGRVPEPMLSIHHAQEPEQPMLLYTLSPLPLTDDYRCTDNAA